MLTAVGHLENYGYAKKLRTSKGEERILLARFDPAGPHVHTEGRG